MNNLECPCGGRSFDVPVEGYQEKMTFAHDGDSVRVTGGSAVHVNDHNSDHLVCRSCGEVVSESELVESDE